MRERCLVRMGEWGPSIIEAVTAARGNVGDVVAPKPWYYAKFA